MTAHDPFTAATPTWRNAARLGARSGSPFASDRDFRRKSRRDRRRELIGESVILAVAVLILAVGFAALGARDARLVAYGCDGAAGPLYAAEESDFPPCRAIEPRG